MKHYLLLFISIFLFIACEQKEQPRPRHKQGDLSTTSLNMDKHYKYQVFFDFSLGKEVSRNLKTDWNLKFHNGKVYTNTATSMSVAKVKGKTLAEITSKNDLKFKYDVASQHSDSLMTDEVNPENEIVYVYDLGYDTELNPLKLYKSNITYDSKTHKVKLVYQELNGKTKSTVELMDEEPVYFSFQKKEVNIGSPSWDVCFTQYINVFQNPYNPYLVTGVLSNHSNIKISELKEGAPFTFASYSFDNVNDITFNNKADEIGYDWKTYSFDTHGFSINKTKFYVLKDKEGRYFKIRFIDFYNQKGEKGNPTFEYQEL